MFADARGTPAYGAYRGEANIELLNSGELLYMLRVKSGADMLKRGDD